MLFKMLIWKTYFPIIYEFYNNYTVVKTRPNHDLTSSNLTSSHYILGQFLLCADTPPTKNFIRLPWPLSDSCPSLPPLALTISLAPELLNHLTLLHPGQRASK